MKKEIFNRIIDCVSTITEIDKEDIMKRYTKVWEQKNPRIVMENKETKTIKTKKSKGIKCKTCQENK